MKIITDSFANILPLKKRVVGFTSLNLFTARYFVLQATEGLKSSII